MSSVPDNVLNKSLYLKVKEEAKRKFSVWPSAYGSAFLVKEYKRRGGKYKTVKKGRSSQGLNRWFDEKWIDVCYYPKLVTCGRAKGGYASNVRKYPYCRPSKRINRSTPKTVQELSPTDRQRRCATKRKSPFQKIKK